jgi:hypothetical protein
MRKLSILFFLSVAILSYACKIKEDPKKLCVEPELFELAAFTTVVADTIANAEDSGTYWVCNGGILTLSGKNNLVLVDSGAVVVIDGSENEIVNLEGGLLTLNGKENEAWLNGESKTYVYGYENQLYYYWVGQLYEYGNDTSVDDLCENVEVDFRQAPSEGCR